MKIHINENRNTDANQKGGKQMVRRISLSVCLVALIGFVALPAFAAVQNVKISGDINVSGVTRSNLDLDKSSSVANSVGVNSNQDSQSDFFSITRVKVDADQIG